METLSFLTYLSDCAQGGKESKYVWRMERVNLKECPLGSAGHLEQLCSPCTAQSAWSEGGRGILQSSLDSPLQMQPPSCCICQRGALLSESSSHKGKQCSRSRWELFQFILLEMVPFHSGSYLSPSATQGGPSHCLQALPSGSLSPSQ